MKLPKGVIQLNLNDPEECHNLLADIFGEPRVNPYRRRVLRKDNGVSPKASGGNSDDGPSEQSK
jgi:hypothetical protein